MGNKGGKAARTPETVPTQIEADKPRSGFVCPDCCCDFGTADDLIVHYDMLHGNKDGKASDEGMGKVAGGGGGGGVPAEGKEEGGGVLDFIEPVLPPVLPPVLLVPVPVVLTPVLPPVRPPAPSSPLIAPVLPPVVYTLPVADVRQVEAKEREAEEIRAREEAEAWAEQHRREVEAREVEAARAAAVVAAAAVAEQQRIEFHELLIDPTGKEVKGDDGDGDGDGGDGGGNGAEGAAGDGYWWDGHRYTTDPTVAGFHVGFIADAQGTKIVDYGTGTSTKMENRYNQGDCVCMWEEVAEVRKCSVKNFDEVVHLWYHNLREFVETGTVESGEYPFVLQFCSPGWLPTVKPAELKALRDYFCETDGDGKRALYPQPSPPL